MRLFIFLSTVYHILLFDIVPYMRARLIQADWSLLNTHERRKKEIKRWASSRGSEGEFVSKCDGKNRKEEEEMKGVCVKGVDEMWVRKTSLSCREGRGRPAAMRRCHDGMTGGRRRKTGHIWLQITDWCCLHPGRIFINRETGRNAGKKLHSAAARSHDFQCSCH